MISIDRASGVVAAVAATIVIAWASNVRLTPNVGSESVLRLTWSARPERVEDCRTASDEDMAKLPAHMRQATVCEGTTATYRLEVRRDGQIIAEQTVRGGGLRHDRPLYVFRDIPIPAGDSTVTVTFTRLGSTTSTGDADDRGRPRSIDDARRHREDDERRRQREEAVPAVLTLEQQVRTVPREVVLVTYDAERRRLQAATGPR